MIVKSTPGGLPLVFPEEYSRIPATPGANDFADLMAAYQAGDNRAGVEAFARIVQAIDKDTRTGHDPATRAEFGRTMTAALSVFVQPDFVIPDDLIGRVLPLVPVIANVMGGLQTTTDAFIRMVEGQPQAGIKSAIMGTARNTIGMNLGAMLEQAPMIASAWLNQAIKVMYSGNADPEVSERMRWILDAMDERYEPCSELQELYFLVSYLGDFEVEKKVKSYVNTAIKRHLDRKIANTPNPRKIAVWAEYWNAGHSVHRTLKGFIDALRPHFDEITLIHAVKKTEDLDTPGFDRVIRLEHDGFKINPSPLDGNEWAAVVFADVGMTLPSILMSNLRIAPVQVLLTGHPVSTFGGEMDWFVSGALTDTNAANYSERLAILPGFGAIHEPVEWVPTERPGGREEIVVNVSAYGQKVHWQFLQTINEAFGHATRPVRLQLFSGNAPMTSKGLAAFADAVAAAVPNAHVEMLAHLDYESYMKRLANADFGVDSWPFGGSNVMSDQIAVGVPVLCMAGDRWFNSIGPAMMRCLGYAPRNGVDEFRKSLKQLVSDPNVLSAFRGSMRYGDFAAVYDRSDGEIFARFVQDLANDPRHFPGSGPVWLGGQR